MKRTFFKACMFIGFMTTILIQAPPSSSSSTISRVRGNQFTPQVADTQSAAAIGTLNSNFGSGGSLSVDSVISGGTGSGIQVLPTGDFLTVVSEASSASAVALYNAQGTLQTTYGASGIATLGTSSTSLVPRATILDAQGRLVVSGGAFSGTAGWIYRVSTDGTTASAFTTGTAWQYIAGLAEQSSGEIVAVGFNGFTQQVGRYTLAGALDTTFGTSGLVTFDGTGGLPRVTTPLGSVIVDADNKIYVACQADLTNASYTSNNIYLVRLTATGAFDTSWGTSGILNISALNSASSAVGIYCAFNQDGNIILAGQVSNKIVVAAVTSSGGAVGGFTTFNSSLISGNNFVPTQLVTTSDDSIFVVGSNTTTNQMAVIRLVGATGALDTAFNTTGYNLFNPTGSSITASYINAISVAPDGQLFAAGYQTASATTTPYVSCLNNTHYVSQVAQFPTVQEQGILDVTFGDPSRSSYAGVTSLANGLYGSLLQQKSMAAIEVTAGTQITVGNIVVGMNGSTNASSNSSMMLAFLDQEGALDTTTDSGAIPASGYLTLAHDTTAGFSTNYPNEYVNTMAQDGSGNLYVAGYASATTGGASGAATLRIYSSFTTGNANADAYISETGATYQGVGVALQGNTRSLLCVAESATVGHISGYAGGVLDTTFGVGATVGGTTGSGQILATSYGLNMGPCYGLVVTANNEIYAAYVDSSNQQVNLVAFEPNGSALLSTFGAAGVVADIFNTYAINPNNVRIGFRETTTQTNDIVVAAVTATGFVVASFDPQTGALSPDFNNGAILPVTVPGATSLQLSRVTGVSDGSDVANGAIILTFSDNATDDTMYVARVANNGTLDTTFNSQGSQPGVLPIQIGDKVADYYARVATSAVVQSTAGANQGNIVCVGYESVTANDATALAMRVNGLSGSTEIIDFPVAVAVPGTFDSAFDLSTNPAISAGAGNVVFAYPSGNANQGKLLIGIDNGTTSIIARVYQTNMVLDTTFGTAGIYLADFLPGIAHLSIDAQNNILAGGSAGGDGWAQVINNAGTSVTSFALVGLNIAAVNAIAQQQSGRYIIAGNELTTGQGILVAFQDKLVGSAIRFAVDPTFNPLSVGSVPFAGSYYIGGTTDGLYAMSINTANNGSPLCAIDTIVVAYAVSNVVKVAEITADGSGLVAGFNNGVVVTTDVAADSSASCSVNIDGSNNIVVGASRNTGGTHQVQVQRFDSAGGTTTAFTNGGIVTGSVATITNLGNSGITLSSLMATTRQQTVLVGYNTAGGNGPLFAARLAATGDLDATWNTTSPVGTDTAGVLTYSADSAVNLNGAAIAVDGTIVSIGSTATNTLGNPIVTLVYGDSYVAQVSQNPLEQPAGVVDTTLPGGLSGAAATALMVTGVPQKVYIYNEEVNNSPNGAMLVASTADATVYVTQLNADLSVNSANFGISGIVTLTPNSGTTPTSVTVTDMYVANGVNDTAQPIYITGYTTASAVNTPFAIRIASNGSSTTTAPVSALTTTGCIRQSSNGRVLVSGYNGSFGALVAYNSDMTAIDTSFGTAGYYVTTTANPIAAMTTDNSDRIYIAYLAGSGLEATLERVLENGTGLDSTYTAGSILATSATQLKLAIDLTNSQITVATQDGSSAGNVLQVARYNLSNGAAAGTASTVTLASKVLNLSDLFIDNNSTVSAYPNIYVVGYNSTDNQSIVARLATTSSTIALDTSYATTGIANLATGLLRVVTAGALDPDRRVYIVGSNGSTTGYMGRVFGDYYWTEQYPAILQGVVGTIDLTLTPDFTGGLNLSDIPVFNALASYGYAARAIEYNTNNDGTAYIAFGNGTDLIVGQVDADMNAVTTFGTDGLTSTVPMATVNSLTIDAAGNIIVAGTNAGAQKVVSFTSAGVLNATFATSTLASTVGTVVVQQKSGRYIVGGYNGTSTGLISAYKNQSAIASASLPVDLTFGLAENNGYYPTNVDGQIDDMVIDSNDYIYYVYRDGSYNVWLGKLTPNGSGACAENIVPADQVFNTTGDVLNTSIVGLSTSSARIAINAAGDILVGANTTAGIVTQLYDNQGSAIGSQVQVYNTATPVLTKLVGSLGTQNEFYGSFYATGNNAGVFAITSGGLLDTAFNPSGSTPGVNTTTVEIPVQVSSLAIQPDGKVSLVGYTTTGSTAPILVRFYGYPYIAQQDQAPDLVAAGQLDTTLFPATGALNFASYFADNSGFATAITAAAISRVYEAGNGVMTFVADNGSGNTVIFQLNKDLTLNAAFSSDGYREFSTNYGDTTGLYVNSLGNIYITGNNSSASWAVGMSSTGDNLDPVFTAQESLSLGCAIAQQGSGRVILAGQGSVVTGQANTDGYLLGFTNAGAYDTSFGSLGQVDMGVTTPITDIAVDSTVYDGSIIAVSNNAGSVILQRVSPSGLTVSTLYNTAITSAAGNPKVVFDNNGNIVIAAATPVGYVVNSYTNDTGATPIGSATIQTGSSNNVLSNIYATSDGKITLVGYDSTTGYACVARLVSDSGSLVLDRTTFNVALTGVGLPTAGVLVTSTLSNAGAEMNQVFDAIIHADDRIMLVGSNSSTAAPYMGRVFGDAYVSYVTQAPAQGVAGTLDTSFGNTSPANGAYNLSTLNAVLTGAQGKALFPVADGGYYIAFNNANTAANSILIKTLANGSLDTSYNNTVGGHISGIAGSATSPQYAPLGVNSILEDGSSRIVLVGTTAGAGWAQRYAADGTLDTTFGTSGVVSVGAAATVALEQTLARLVVAGQANNGHAALFAFTSLDPLTGTTGAVDTTFNAPLGGTSAGLLDTGVVGTLYNVVADSYDRLIFALVNGGGTAVNLYRLTPTGELDVTFGTAGVVSSALTSVGSGQAASVRVALDAAGNIIVAATSSAQDTISIRAYDNGTLTGAGANGTQVYAQLDIALLTNSPVVTNLITSADGYALVVGTQSGTYEAWIARITAGGLLDTTGFNPAGTIPGIFQYAGSGTTTHVYNALAINTNGTIGMLGYENSAGVYTPELISVFNDPYTSQESQTPDSQPVGTNDLTFGVSAATSAAKGVVFANGTSAGQQAQAVALYDDNNIVVAFDGTTSGNAYSSIFMAMFDNDGIANPNFGTAGQATLLTGSASPISPSFQNQYVTDMVSYTTTAGVRKAIVAGYAYNSALPVGSQYGSLLMQYVLTPGSQALDTANFGGYDDNAAGIAFGDGQKAFVVGQQSTGRIVAGGLSQDNLGLLLGYTASGKLDSSFGNSGYQSVGTGSSGIYSHAIDTENRIVIVYNTTGTVAVARFLADGSAPDGVTFTPALTTGSANTDMKVAVDSSNNVVVAATAATPNAINVKLIPVIGGTATITGSFSYSQLGESDTGNYTLGRVMVDAQGNVLVVAYNTVDAHKNVVVMRLVESGSNYILDTTFNTTGYVKYAVAAGIDSQVATDALVHPDGRIIVVGSKR